MSYAFVHEGQAFTPDGRAAIADVEAHNAAVEKAELAAWQAAPDRFAAYVTKEGLTTWRGTVIGAIVRRSRYTNNLGARIECVTARGTNGATYTGRYSYEWSQLIRLRKARG